MPVDLSPDTDTFAAPARGAAVPGVRPALAMRHRWRLFPLPCKRAINTCPHQPRYRHV